MKSYKHVFGPVPSRRLGVSLGIDLVPFKVCTLDCVYCEIGKTEKPTIERAEYVSYEEVISEIDDCLSAAPELDYITFSGAGEPTLNNRIGDIITFLKTNYPYYKIALITNGTLFTSKEIRTECLNADLILPSLDAVSDEAFNTINRPHNALNNKAIIEGLVELRKEFDNQLWLEVFIVPGINDNPEELSLLKENILRINPDCVQLNSLDRPGTEQWVSSAAEEQMEIIKDFLYPLPIKTIKKFRPREKVSSYKKQNEEMILSTLIRRPCTENDLIKLTGLKINELNKYLSNLLSKKIIKEEYSSRGLFFRIKKDLNKS